MYDEYKLEAWLKFNKEEDLPTVEIYSIYGGGHGYSEYNNMIVPNLRNVKILSAKFNMFLNYSPQYTVEALINNTIITIPCLYIGHLMVRVNKEILLDDDII